MTPIVNEGSYPLGAADEAPHPPSAGQLWNESYYLDFVTADGTAGGYVRLGLYPNWDRAWYWACLVRAGQPAVTIVDHDVPLPSEAGAVAGRDFRAGYEVTRPLELARATLESARLGLDLQWRTAGGVYGYSLVPRYEVPCTVTGTVRVDGQYLAVSGFGERDHSWGVRDWWTVSWLWSSGRLDDGSYLHAMRPNLGVELPWPSFTVPPGGVLAPAPGLTVATDFTAAGRPERTRLRLAGADLTVTPRDLVSITMTSPGGADAHFARALCTFRAADGRGGYGWTEWHQPPGWRDHPWADAAAPPGGRAG
jgi:hypothetical protein